MFEDDDEEELCLTFNLFPQRNSQSIYRQEFSYPQEGYQEFKNDSRMSQNNFKSQFSMNQVGSQENIFETQPTTSSNYQDSNHVESLDLSYNEKLKVTVEKLSQELASNRQNFENNREVINKLHESKEKLSNKLEVLMYNRSVSFNAYSELKESCESLIDEQKKVLAVIKETESSYHHVKSYVSSCKQQMDQVVQAVEKQKLLFEFSLQDIKNKGSSVISSHKHYLEELEELNKIIEAKKIELDLVDRKPLDNAKACLANILEINNQLTNSLKEQNDEMEQVEMKISEDKSSETQTMDNLDKSIQLLKDEIIGKESKLNDIAEEKKLYQTKYEDLINKIEDIKSSTDTINQELIAKQKKKSDLIDSISKLHEALKDSQQNTKRLDELEPQVCLKRNELERLRNKIKELNSSVENAKTQNAINNTKYNEIITLKTDMESAVSSMKNKLENLMANIDSHDRIISEKMQDNEEIRIQIKECEDKLVCKESDYKKEKECLLSEGNNYKSHLDSLKEKLNGLNKRIELLNNETNEKQNELNRMHCETMMENEIQTIMDERDIEEQSQTIAKYKELKELLELHEKEIDDDRKAKVYFSEELKSLTQHHASEFQEKKKKLDDMKNQIYLEIRSKQKELSAITGEKIKLSRVEEELDFLLTEINNNKSLYDCKEVMLKSQFKWAAKQFIVAQPSIRKPAVFTYPKDGKKDWSHPVEIQTNINTSQSREKELKVEKGTKSNVITRSAAMRKSSIRDESAASSSSISTSGRAKNKNPLPETLKESLKLMPNEENKATDSFQNLFTSKKQQSIQPKLLPTTEEINSDSESISPICPNEKLVAPNQQVSQLSTSTFPRRSQIPFFTEHLKKFNKNVFEDNFITTESSTYDSASTADIKETIKIETAVPSCSTPVQDLEHDSDYSFNQSLKHTNKVILKSRMISKGREKQMKKSNLNTIICLDSD